MAIRTSVDEVKKILDDSQLSDDVITAYITSANALVDEVVGSDTTLSSNLKTEIEKWLSAHLISVTRERMAMKEKAGSVGITYTGTYGQNLSSSTYGQTVLTLDTTGKFAALGGKAVIIEAVTSFD